MLSACNPSKTPKKYKRVTYVFVVKDAKKLHYEFTKAPIEGMVQYKYSCKEFADRGISFTYSKEQESIIWLGEVFKINSNQQIMLPRLSKKPFKIYDIVMPYSDASGPLIFNPDYGLLVLYNSYGPVLTFLKNEDSTLAEQLYDFETLITE
ncbi:hypothetical protein NBRC110019_31630 [Neptunitalea chrysea]|uniref:Uncharacterized protein n=2 Tax=Neptunitalea chrysea TaxID=1647581 RepID=A0A9W6B8Q1_9FLAO|nr:hypothetical protein NBRC110019_31630 [Neptunitalea chrysea]